MKENLQVVLGLLFLSGILIGSIWYKAFGDNELSNAIQLARFEEEEQGYYSADTMVLFLNALSKELADKMKNITLTYRKKQRENFGNLKAWLEINLEYQATLAKDGINDLTSVITRWGVPEDVWLTSISYNIEDPTFRTKLEEMIGNYHIFPQFRELNNTEIAEYLSAQIEYLESNQQELVTLKKWLRSNHENIEIALWSRMADYVYLKTQLESEGFTEFLDKHKQEFDNDPRIKTLFSKFQNLAGEELFKRSEKEQLEELSSKVQAEVSEL